MAALQPAARLESRSKYEGQLAFPPQEQPQPAAPRVEAAGLPVRKPQARPEVALVLPPEARPRDERRLLEEPPGAHLATPLLSFV